MIRRATGRDVEGILRMGLRFHAESRYAAAMTPNVEQLARLLEYLLEFGFLLVLERNGDVVGMLAAHALPNPVSGELVASEVAWWVDPEYRGGSGAVRMLVEFEEWAEERGAFLVQMIAPAGSSIGRLYMRRGYEQLETTWQRRLAQDTAHGRQ